MKTIHRGFIIPLVLALIAFALAGGGAYVYTQQKQANENVVITPNTQATSTTQNSATQSNNWKTYTNTALGFSIKYPTDWKIDSFRSDRTKSGSDVVFDIGQQSESHEGIRVDKSNLSLDEWADKNRQAFVTEGTFQGVSRMVIGGQSRYELTRQHGGKRR